jgi:hypothetical protein
MVEVLPMGQNLSINISFRSLWGGENPPDLQPADTDLPINYDKTTV